MKRQSVMAAGAPEPDLIRLKRRRADPSVVPI